MVELRDGLIYYLIQSISINYICVWNRFMSNNNESLQDKSKKKEKKEFWIEKKQACLNSMEYLYYILLALLTLDNAHVSFGDSFSKQGIFFAINLAKCKIFENSLNKTISFQLSK